MKRALLLLLLAGHLQAAASDDDLVHGLAHYGAGNLVAQGTASVIFLFSTIEPFNSGHPFECILAEAFSAYAITDGYEQGTKKPTTVRLQHDLDAIAGGLVAGININIKF